MRGVRAYIYIYGGGRFIRICPYINVAPKLPNVNIQIDPFATLVPKCQYSDRSICNIGTQITKCQYSDRSICNIGTQMSIFGYQCCKWIWPNIIHLAGAAIRTRNHNYEDRNYDLNAHPHVNIILESRLVSGSCAVILSNACDK